MFRKLYHACNIVILPIYIFFASHILPWLCIIECIVPPPPYHQYHVTPSLIFIMMREMMFIHDMISVILDSTKNIFYPRDTKNTILIHFYRKIIIYEKDRVDVALFHRIDDRIMGYFFLCFFSKILTDW